MTPNGVAAPTHESSSSPPALLVENVADPGFVLTARGAIAYANEAAERLCDTNGAQLAGKLFPTLLGRPFAAQYEVILNALAARETQPMLGQPRAVVILRCDGSRVPVELSMSEVQVGNAQWLVAVARELGVDVDERSQREETEPLPELAAVTPVQVG